MNTEITMKEYYLQMVERTLEMYIRFKFPHIQNLIVDVSNKTVTFSTGEYTGEEVELFIREIMNQK